MAKLGLAWHGKIKVKGYKYDNFKIKTGRGGA
jgi:hypothetical protein